MGDKDAQRRAGGWYGRWRVNHTWVSLLVTGAVISVQVARFGTNAQASIPLVPSQSEVLLLAVAVALFGVPHGATDHLVGASIFQKAFQSLWLPVFVVVYLALMALVVLCWSVAPSFSLAAFLLMSVAHWGLGDVEEDLSPSVMFWLEVAVRGGVAIV
eukprot:CAMPEP_0114146034 /NCGR_PEP_ID=MMETSP0043_2-20121206/20355_1 /TAXON_ID=464988 /ORGANISM="Hemiselmis andersenii, Strain CCMP644" /LENGTH=157 /DNA_ID=CAMNT_0001240473 /DNA_START=12 /DNA_END=481 /DNA_ORIENTATION=+